MPVPVSPCKSGSSQGVDVSTLGSEVQRAQESSRSPPGSPRPREEGGEIADPDVIAGYQDCLKETLRFLLEEEDLPADHPVVMGLVAHLTREHAHVELTKISQQLANSIVTTQINTANMQVEEMSSSNHVNALKLPTALNAGFEVTLVQDDDDDDDDEIVVLDDDEAMDEEECEFINVDDFSDSEETEEYEASECEEDEIADTLMQDPELQQQLIRLVYQGCNLFAAPHPLGQALHHGLVLQL